MRPLQTYIVLWASPKKIFLVELAKFATVERWECVSDIPSICQILTALKQDDPEGFNVCTVVSPTGFIYTAKEFLEEFCPGVVVEKLPQPSTQVEEVVPFTREY